MTDFKKLGDIATYINGYAFKPEDRGNEGLPIIRIQDLTGNSYDLGFYNGEYPERIEINNGDVLISWSGSLGVYLWNKGKALLNQHIFKVVFDKAEIDKSYFIYAIQHYLKEMEAKTHGATMKHITKKDFDDMLVPYPNMQKQRETAGILNMVDGIIVSCQQELTKLDELVKSRFVEMFGEQKANPKGLPVARLSEVTDISLGLTHTPTYVSEGKPFLSVRDISSGIIDFSNCHYITDREFNSLPNGAKPREGDILFCRVGTIGKPVVIPKGTPEFGTFVSVGYLRKKDNMTNCYLKAWMENDYFMQQVLDNVSGASQINLNTGWLKNFQILLPDLEMQTRFEVFCNQVDKSKLSYEMEVAA